MFSLHFHPMGIVHSVRGLVLMANVALRDVFLCIVGSALVSTTILDDICADHCYTFAADAPRLQQIRATSCTHPRFLLCDHSASALCSPTPLCLIFGRVRHHLRHIPYFSSGICCVLQDLTFPSSGQISRSNQTQAFRDLLISSCCYWQTS